MREIFIVSGTHQGEDFPLGRPIADALARKLSKKCKVKRIDIPLKTLKGQARRTKPSGEDQRANASFQYVKTKGYDSENPNHMLIDTHEIEINMDKLESPIKRQFKKYVKPAVQRSMKEGYFGVYYVEIGNPPDFNRIWEWKRRSISMISNQKSNIMRIETPIVYGKRGRIDLRSTKNHYSDLIVKRRSNLWKNDVAEKLSDIVIKFLKI
jgi:hypothetical protein